VLADPDPDAALKTRPQLFAGPAAIGRLHRKFGQIACLEVDRLRERALWRSTAGADERDPHQDCAREHAHGAQHRPAQPPRRMDRLAVRRRVLRGRSERAHRGTRRRLAIGPWRASAIGRKRPWLARVGKASQVCARPAQGLPAREEPAGKRQAFLALALINRDRRSAPVAMDADLRHRTVIDTPPRPLKDPAATRRTTVRETHVRPATRYPR
jgi:hypothetical protein